MSWGSQEPFNAADWNCPACGTLNFGSKGRTRCFSCGATCDGTSPGEESLDSTKLFLGALPKDTPQETLKEYFSQFGPVADAFCMKARNFGFVRFETEEGAQLVMASGPHIIGGKELDIKQITVPDPKSQPGAPRASGKGKGKAGESGKGKGKGKGDPYDSRKRTAGQIDNVPMTAGDWRCNACGNLNFARRTACNKCGAPKPEDADWGGDWSGQDYGGYGGGYVPGYEMPPPEPSLPAGWEEAVDPRTGKTYYMDHLTKTTHWSLPPAISAEPPYKARRLESAGWGKGKGKGKW